MDAKHFRKRAAEVRVLASTARDPEIHTLLVDMISDLEAEAAALDAKPPAVAASRRLQACGTSC